MNAYDIPNWAVAALLILVGIGAASAASLYYRLRESDADRALGYPVGSPERRLLDDDGSLPAPPPPVADPPPPYDIAADPPPPYDIAADPPPPYDIAAGLWLTSKRADTAGAPDPERHPTHRAHAGHDVQSNVPEPDVYARVMRHVPEDIKCHMHWALDPSTRAVPSEEHCKKCRHED